jgi:asparagine synthase (glutamine-hydrolysing)
MCGIIGIIASYDEKYKKAIDQIAHRGPDSTGFFNTVNLLLGHTRLSIQDLSENGNQPMFSDDGRFVIIFNGEIYNHNDIRNELLSDINFKSTGDTETVLYAYIKYGPTIFEKLNGIFAMAIYDNHTNEIIIVRDHFGVKPLYFCHDKDLFLFGSEFKSFLPYTINKELSANSLFDYITFLWCPGERTPFLGVKKLEPGTYLKFNISKIEDLEPVSFYNYFANKNTNTSSEEKIINELELYLLNAVKRQMLSDVPIGFFLSGGLDSSLLVAMARKLYPEKKFQCFTIDVGMGKSEFEGFADDIVYARRVAELLNVDLNVVKAEDDIVQLFDKIIWHLDEPQADAAPINVFKISNLAREKGIKVLIGGAAGDDIFSGYRRHQALNFELYIKFIPIYVRNIVIKISTIIPTLSPFLRRIKKLISNFHKASIERQYGYFSWLSEKSVRSLFSNEWKKKINQYNPFEYFIKLQKEIPYGTNDLERMLYWELKTFLVSHNLNYTDKLSMAVGVEARVPYLDLDLVEYAKTIPSSLKMKGNETKYILKKVAERYLPLDVIYRPKTGFGAPIRQWITSDLEPMINERLSPERINKRGIFDPESVWKLINDNKKGKIDASYSIWALLAIESWCMQFIDNNDLLKKQDIKLNETNNPRP